VWWIWVVNLVLAWLSSLPARATLSSVLNHSLQSARFVTGFDAGAFAVMLIRPDVQPGPLATSAITAAVVFLTYLLFLDGGIFAVYLDDRKLSRAEFFESSGLYFWRMFRLSLYSLIPFALISAANGSIAQWAGKLSNDAAPERLGFFVNLGGKLLCGLLFLFVRLWFDLAQARLVKDNERKVLRTAWRSLKLALHSGRLYASYVGIAIFSIAVFALGTALWYYLPHRATGASFLILELVTIVMISSRLWIKAASARSVALMPAEVLIMSPLAPPMAEPTLNPAEVAEGSNAPEPPKSE
jgi:hypothetical protein